jgi:murein L,D-transpeptidase YafK
MKRKYFLFTVIVMPLMIYYFYPEKKIGNNKIELIEVFKSERKLFLYSEGKVVNTYTISLGSNPIGYKTAEGDGKTPEGTYFIDGKNDKSICYKNLGISYPNNSDKENRYSGGAIKIHGLRNGFGLIGKYHRLYDWTNGCIAVTDSEMEDLYNHIKVGTKIKIYK